MLKRQLAGDRPPLDPSWFFGITQGGKFCSGGGFAFPAAKSEPSRNRTLQKSFTYFRKDLCKHFRKHCCQLVPLSQLTIFGSSEIVSRMTSKTLLKKLLRISSAILLVLFLTSCTTETAPVSPPVQLKPFALDSTVQIVAGQTVYVPVYSYIYAWEQTRRMNLTATLSVRNTDISSSIIVSSVNYYDSNGKLLKSHLEQPIELGALSSASFVVEQEDVSGGAGSSFLVEWVSQQQVTEPVIEAIMINASGNQGISFVSPGRVIKRRAE